jgi:hypothetical protein
VRWEEEMAKNETKMEKQERESSSDSSSSSSVERDDKSSDDDCDYRDSDEPKKQPKMRTFGGAAERKANLKLKV